MQLDAKTAAIGTKGFTAVCLADLYTVSDSLDFLKDPDVVLREDRRWVSIEVDEETGQPHVAVDEVPIFSDWQSALRYTLSGEIQSAMDTIAEAMDTLKQVKLVEQLLNDSQ